MKKIENLCFMLSLQHETKMWSPYCYALCSKTCQKNIVACNSIYQMKKLENIIINYFLRRYNHRIIFYEFFF